MEILVNSCALPFSSSFSRALLRTATALGSAMVTYRDFVMDVGDMDDGESGNATTCRTSDRKGTPAADHRFSRYLLTLGCVFFFRCLLFQLVHTKTKRHYTDIRSPEFKRRTTLTVTEQQRTTECVLRRS